MSPLSNSQCERTRSNSLVKAEIQMKRTVALSQQGGQALAAFVFLSISSITQNTMNGFDVFFGEL